MHGASIAMRGEKSMEDVARATVFSRQNFPSVLVVACVVSGLAGFQFMESIQRQVLRAKAAWMNP